MEKISAKMFFTVLWRGVCQALGWFLGLFGYKRDGKFAKCVWGLFATSAAVVMAFMAIAALCVAREEWYDRCKTRLFGCTDPDCWATKRVRGDIFIHNHYDGKGYIYNIRTGEKYLKHVAWIARPTDKDSLICFSNGKKRGYFSKNTGKVVVEPQYDHAWIFSEGLAAVEMDGCIKFIDGTGKVVIDNGLAYNPRSDGYVFHRGYCVIETEEGLWGLMDHNGTMALPLEYEMVNLHEDEGLWCVLKDEKMAVLDCDLKPILPLAEWSIYIDEGTIDVTMPDHTMRKYDAKGTLINDFYISGIHTLEYEKDEILYRRSMTEVTEMVEDEYVSKEVPTVESYHPRATALLRAYTGGDGFEGLMTAGGHPVTMPLYRDIEALDHDLYLCTSTNGDMLIVNGKGEAVR